MYQAENNQGAQGVTQTRIVGLSIFQGDLQAHDKKGQPIKEIYDYHRKILHGWPPSLSPKGENKF